MEIPKGSERVGQAVGVVADRGIDQSLSLLGDVAEPGIPAWLRRLTIGHDRPPSEAHAQGM